MPTLLAALARPATKRPGTVLGAILLVTVILAMFASNLQVETDLAAFRDEQSDTVAALDRVRDEFGGDAAMVQVILDAGAGGDILTADGLRAVLEAESAIAEALGDSLRSAPDGSPAVTSLAQPLAAALEQQQIPMDVATDEEVAAAATRLIEANPRLASLTSEDRDIDSGRARATFLASELDPDLTNEERTDAGQRVEHAFGFDEAGLDAEWNGYQVAVFSPELLDAGLQDEMAREMPLLFGLALLLVVVILILMLRSFFDVAVGLVGLAVTVVWTFGLITLAGPGYLDWLGALSQIGIVVPVLLVGLGIDYAVHLTSRYREQRGDGEAPPAAAQTAVVTVGTALVLATVATALGFATAGTAPVQMIADFGIFTAMGVVCAFVVMVLLVPAASVLRDRRKGRGGASKELSLRRLARAATAVATRWPAAALGVAGLLVAASLWAATGLETEFSREDFIPEGSTVGQTLALQRELFGGDLSEVTYVVVDGDLTDPEVVNALLEAHDNLADVDGVRLVDGQPQAQSVATMARAAVTQETTGAPSSPDGMRNPAGSGGQPDAATDSQDAPNPAAAASLHDAWTGDGFAEDADLAALYALLRQTAGEEAVGHYVSDAGGAGVVEIQTSVGSGSRADGLRQRLIGAFQPVVAAGAAVRVTSDELVITEMATELGDFQAQSVVTTLAAVLLLLIVYYGISKRRPHLGAIAMIPAAFSAAMVLGVMWIAGMSVNPVTATMTAISIGIGVPYGIHVINRFLEDLGRKPGATESIESTLRNTGGALTGSALTTLGAFIVLSFAGLYPIQQLGILGAAAIAFALLGAMLVEPGALILWARRRPAVARRTPERPR